MRKLLDLRLLWLGSLLLILNGGCRIEEVSTLVYTTLGEATESTDASNIETSLVTQYLDYLVDCVEKKPHKDISIGSDGTLILGEYQSGGVGLEPAVPTRFLEVMGQEKSAKTKQSENCDKERNRLLSKLVDGNDSSVAIVVGERNIKRAKQGDSIQVISEWFEDYVLDEYGERLCNSVHDSNYKVVTRAKGDRKICTAFLLNNRQIASARHCFLPIGGSEHDGKYQRLWKKIDQSIFVFGFTGVNKTFDRSMYVEGRDIESVYFTDVEQEDWILLNMKDDLGPLKVMPIGFPMITDSNVQSQLMFHIGHPLGREQVVDIGPIIKTADPIFHYLADSYWSISGAPVFIEQRLAGVMSGGPAVQDIYRDASRECYRPFICCEGLTRSECEKQSVQLEKVCNSEKRGTSNECACMSVGAKALSTPLMRKCFGSSSECNNLLVRRLN